MPTPAAVKWTTDTARGIALLPNGVGGYVLDGTGALHAFGGAPKTTKWGPSWPGQDKARGVAISPDGSGGWIIDSLGGLYPFGIGDERQAGCCRRRSEVDDTDCSRRRRTSLTALGLRPGPLGPSVRSSAAGPRCPRHSAFLIRDSP